VENSARIGVELYVMSERICLYVENLGIACDGKPEANESC